MDDAPAWVEWLHDLPISTYIRESLYLYPALEVIHVVGALLLLGSIAIVDLRLLGAIFRDQPISRISAQVLPLAFLGALLGFTSGILLFLSEAQQVWNNPMMAGKFALLILAGINIGLWHLAEARNRARWDAQASPSVRAQIAGGSSLLLWMSILVLGRLIAFVF
ncbi:MAG: hypothetical protein QM581_02525 [Pseudomonas sp.]